MPESRPAHLDHLPEMQFEIDIGFLRKSDELLVTNKLRTRLGGHLNSRFHSTSERAPGCAGGCGG
jgi:hypothetical protein